MLSAFVISYFIWARASSFFYSDNTGYSCIVCWTLTAASFIKSRGGLLLLTVLLCADFKLASGLGLRIGAGLKMFYGLIGLVGDLIDLRRLLLLLFLRWVLFFIELFFLIVFGLLIIALPKLVSRLNRDGLRLVTFPNDPLLRILMLIVDPWSLPFEDLTFFELFSDAREANPKPRSSFEGSSSTTDA